MSVYKKGAGLLRVVYKSNLKTAPKKVSVIGKYYPFNDGLDAYQWFEVEGLPATPTEKEFLEGNPDRLSYYVPSDITDIIPPLGVLFPNCTVYVVGNTEQVVTGLDTALAGLTVTVVVPNSLLSAYQTAYASATNLTFTSWQFQQVFTIPYIGESTLTAEYVRFVANNASGDIETVDIVVIPDDFDTVEIDALVQLQTSFTSLTSINRIMDGVTYSADVSDVVFSEDMTFADSSWDAIKAIAVLGVASQIFALGDEKEDLGTDENARTIRIIDFDHYGKNEINCEQLQVEKQCAFSNQNITDSDGAHNNYSESAIRTSYLPEILAKYSSALQGAIGQTSYDAYKSGLNKTVLTLQDKLFLGSVKEYFGIGTNDPTSNKQFSLYANNNTDAFRIKKRLGTQTNSEYWTRTQTGDPGVFLVIDTGAYYPGGYYARGYLSPVFSIK